MKDREKLHADLLDRIASGVTMTAIAKASGVPYNSIKAFRDMSHLGIEYRARLEKYFEALPPRTSVAVPQQTDDLTGVLLKEIEAVVANLTSPSIDLKRKAERLRQFVKETAPDYIAKAGKGPGDTHA